MDALGDWQWNATDLLILRRPAVRPGLAGRTTSRPLPQNFTGGGRSEPAVAVNSSMGFASL